MLNGTLPLLPSVLTKASSRYDVWINFINVTRISTVAEIGVWKGVFAEQLLRNCPSIERYYMIDPWQHIDGWNKPANVSDDKFEKIFTEAMSRTDFARHKRVVLRARTTEAVVSLPDGELDAVYIDGDHTLRGIVVDLVSIYDKVKPSGFICGDDFVPSIWQHKKEFEPTLVFPLAVHFAEAKGDTIYGLPFNQFLIAKSMERNPFQFRDLVGSYRDTSLRKQLARPPLGRVRRLVNRLRARVTLAAHPSRAAGGL